MKNILFVISNPPHQGTYTLEMLDMIMTVAAFDQQVSLLLLDDAIFQLKMHQDTATSGFKNSAAIFKALPLYDINHLYVEMDSLGERGLTTDGLAETVTPIPRQQIGDFFRQFDLVLPA